MNFRKAETKGASIVQIGEALIDAVERMTPEQRAELREKILEDITSELHREKPWTN